MERLFKLSENQTTVRTEVLAGVTMFLTMAYIIFVQPAVLSGKMFGTNTGLEFGAVTTATCISAALATAMMALYARYPIAQAPGMGENFFFVFSAIPAATAAGFANGWQVALGVVFVSGVLFLILSLIGLRELIFNSISSSLKNGIAAGIGLFVAPALTIVGAMMMQNVTKIDWKDYTESIPAFLIIVGIPFSYSIADGLALGFISYAVVKAFSGRAREISWLTYILGIVLLVYFVFVRSRIG